MITYTPWSDPQKRHISNLSGLLLANIENIEFSMGDADQYIKKLLSDENTKQQTIMELEILAEQAIKVKILKQEQEDKDKKKREGVDITNADPDLQMEDEDTKNDA